MQYVLAEFTNYMLSGYFQSNNAYKNHMKEERYYFMNDMTSQYISKKRCNA